MKTKLTLVSMLAIAVAIPAFADMKIGPLYQKPDINASGETQRAGRG